MKMTTQNAADWAAVIERLEAERAELLAAAAKVRAGKATHALAAATGDAGAKKALSAVDAEAARLAVDAENLELAIAEARQRLVAAEAGEARAREHFRLTELRRVAVARREIAARIEAALEPLVASLAELQQNSNAFAALLEDGDRNTRMAAFRWQDRLPGVLLRRADTAGVALDMADVLPAAGEATVEDTTHLSAADWSDLELEALVDAEAR